MTSEHPRARALRFTYIGCFVLFLVLSAALGVAAQDYRAALIGLGLLTLAFAITALWASSAGMLARGAPATRGERRMLALGLVAATLAGIVAEVLHETSTHAAKAAAWVALGVAILAGLGGLVVGLRSR